jgi:hypothetical protein
MTQPLLAAVGAAIGAVMFIFAIQHRWGWRRIVAANAAASALAGVVAGALTFASNESVWSSFLICGVLGTAAPFVSALLPVPPLRNMREVRHLISRSFKLMTANVLICATAASAAYIVLSGSLIYLHRQI